jgi:hypothetical protein
LGVVSAGEVEEGWGDIGVGDECVVREAAFGGVGCADDEGDVEAGFVDGGFGAGECHAVIGGEEDDGVFVLAGFFECGDECAEGFVGAGDGLVVLCEFAAALDGVREEGWDGEGGGIVEGFLGAGVGGAGGWVSEAVGFEGFGGGGFVAIAAVWIDGPEAEEEGCVGFFR